MKDLETEQGRPTPHYVDFQLKFVLVSFTMELLHNFFGMRKV
jgi:hypothetical protein